MATSLYCTHCGLPPREPFVACAGNPDGKPNHHYVPNTNLSSISFSIDSLNFLIETPTSSPSRGQASFRVVDEIYIQPDFQGDQTESFKSLTQSIIDATQQASKHMLMRVNLCYYLIEAASGSGKTRLTHELRVYIRDQLKHRDIHALSVPLAYHSQLCLDSSELEVAKYLCYQLAARANINLPLNASFHGTKDHVHAFTCILEVWKKQVNQRKEQAVHPILFVMDDSQTFPSSFIQSMLRFGHKFMFNGNAVLQHSFPLFFIVLGQSTATAKVVALSSSSDHTIIDPSLPCPYQGGLVLPFLNKLNVERFVQQFYQGLQNKGIIQQAPINNQYFDTLIAMCSGWPFAICLILAQYENHLRQLYATHNQPLTSDQIWLLASKCEKLYLSVLKECGSSYAHARWRQNFADSDDNVKAAMLLSLTGKPITPKYVFPSGLTKDLAAKSGFVTFVPSQDINGDIQFTTQIAFIMICFLNQYEKFHLIDSQLFNIFTQIENWDIHEDLCLASIQLQIQCLQLAFRQDECHLSDLRPGAFTYVLTSSTSSSSSSSSSGPVDPMTIQVNIKGISANHVHHLAEHLFVKDHFSPIVRSNLGHDQLIDIRDFDKTGGIFKGVKGQRSWDGFILFPASNTLPAAMLISQHKKAMTTEKDAGADVTPAVLSDLNKYVDENAQSIINCLSSKIVLSRQRMISELVSDRDPSVSVLDKTKIHPLQLVVCSNNWEQCIGAGFGAVALQWKQIVQFMIQTSLSKKRAIEKSQQPDRDTSTKLPKSQ